MIKREIHNRCLEISRFYPVLQITGPRQSGKTTLAKMLFPHKAYANLENPDIRSRAHSDPRGFLSQFPNGAILDEIQRAPDLVSYIQQIVDEAKKNAMFILTGSQQFELSQTISQSLAGRSGIVRLLPFSASEIIKNYGKYKIDSLIFSGCYPRIYDQNIPPQDFYPHYFESYVERDLRQLSQIENLSLFEKLLRLLAGRIGQLINYQSLANDIGLSQPTIKKWISILEASYIVFSLPPLHRNIRKRLIKTPKLYFYDTGLAAYLLGINDSGQLPLHPLRGGLFENFVIAEIVKYFANKIQRPQISFFRDRTGNEVDMIIESGMKYHTIEIKSSETFSPFFIKGLTIFNNTFNDKKTESAVIYSGNEAFRFKETEMVPWNRIPDFLNTCKE